MQRNRSCEFLDMEERLPQQQRLKVEDRRYRSMTSMDHIKRAILCEMEEYIIAPV